MKGKRPVREAHFAVASLTLNGESWPTTYAILDVYHHGPDFEDVGAATWEVQFTSARSDGASLQLRREYRVEITTPDGRPFAGRALVEHNVGEVWTLLDFERNLGGLRPEDLT